MADPMQRTEAESLILTLANRILDDAGLPAIHHQQILAPAGNWLVTERFIHSLFMKLKHTPCQTPTKVELGNEILAYVQQHLSFALADAKVSGEQAVLMTKGTYHGKRGTLTSALASDASVEKAAEYKILLEVESGAAGAGEVIKAKGKEFVLDNGSVWLKLPFVAPAQPPAAAPLDKAKLNNKGYLNWLRIGLALRELAEIVAPFIHEQAIAFHAVLMAKVAALGITSYTGDISLYVPDETDSDPAMAMLKPVTVFSVFASDRPLLRWR